MNLLDFCDRLSTSLKKKEMGGRSMLLDCQKAFEIVPHRRLVKKEKNKWEGTSAKEETHQV